MLCPILYRESPSIIALLTDDYLFQDSREMIISDDLHVELAQVFVDKTPEQTERLLNWLKVLAENIDKL